MHIGFVTRFNPAHIPRLLGPSATSPDGRPFKTQHNAALSNLLPELLARGHTIDIFSLDPGCRAPAILAGGRLTLYRLPCRKAHHGVLADQYRQERAALAALLRQVRPDLLHAHWITDGHAQAALDSGLPALITERTALPATLWHNRSAQPDFLRQAVAQWRMTRDVCRRCRHLSAVSPYAAGPLRRFFGYRRPIAILPNALIPPALDPAQRPARPPGQPVFADIARWTRLKNIETLLAAFALVRRRIPGARLLLFGDGLGEAGPARDWAARRNLLENVAFRGPLPSERLSLALYEEVDALVHLSRLETLCNVAMEALMLDIPVIAGRVGGLPWAVDPVPVTFVRNLGNPREAADAMIRIAEAPRPARPPGWAGLLLRRYAPALIADETERLYARVLTEAGLPVTGRES